MCAVLLLLGVGVAVAEHHGVGGEDTFGSGRVEGEVLFSAREGDDLVSVGAAKECGEGLLGGVPLVAVAAGGGNRSEGEDVASRRAGNGVVAEHQIAGVASRYLAVLKF